MTVTVSSFRGAFPVFGDASKYTSTEISFWLDLASKLVSQERWSTLYDAGVQLFVAHNLAIDAGATLNAKLGKAPGQVEGAVTSGSVDKVSYSRDPGSAMDPSNGHWNLTTFGLRYIRLARMLGAGPVQVGAPLGDS